jgi:hypothetical protein
MAGTKGSAQRRSQRDKERAAELKRRGVERTTGRCGNCYRMITIESSKSRYSHRCSVN